MAGPIGCSVHIGLDVVSTFRYGGRLRPLQRACIDMTELAELASRRGFSAVSLRNERATVDAVRDAIATAARELCSGDTFALTFSGHGVGAQTPEGHQQSWCLFDDTLRRHGDGGLDACLAEFETGVRVLVVANCCAGSRAVDQTQRGMRAHVVRIAASSARDVANEGAEGSEPSPFVAAFKTALRESEGVFGFFDRLREECPRNLTPQLEIHDPRSESFLADGPFRLKSTAG